MKTITPEIIKPEDVASIIASIPKGAIFSVEFIKKDKTVRKMNCRQGVVSHLTPPSEKKREKPEMPKNMITVFDMQKGQYRHVNTDTTLKITAERQVFEVKA